MNVLVVGGGAVGIASAWALARRGHDVEVLERFEHVHDRGSHGGYTRIIRQAYHEGSDYVRLVRAADDAWVGLERRAGTTLLVRCGLLELGSPDDPDLLAACASLTAHAIAHETFPAVTAMKRWPFTMPEHWIAVLTPSSGYLRVAACMSAMRDEAVALGARFRYGVRVSELLRGGSRPGVRLEDGGSCEADVLVVAAGAYTEGLLPEFFRDDGGALFRAIRRVLAWTAPAPVHEPALRRLPVWGAFVPEGFFYGFPLADEGVRGFKLACHQARGIDWLDDAIDPDRVRREVDARDLELLTNFLAQYLPAASGPVVHSTVCMYGSTPSGDFVIDADPSDSRVWVAAGFSGHGFKFAPEIGELVSDLVESGTSPRRLPIFRRASHTARQAFA